MSASETEEYILPAHTFELLGDEIQPLPWEQNEDENKKDTENTQDKPTKVEQTKVEEVEDKKKAISYDYDDSEILALDNNYTYPDCNLARFERIDHSLKILYYKLGKRNFVNSSGIGKFMQYIIDNGLEDQDDDEIIDEFAAGHDDCLYVEFDKDDNDINQFPFPITMDYNPNLLDANNEKNKRIWRILKYCYDHGRPPMAHARDKEINLVQGFIREIQKIMENIIIPIDIWGMCRDYYPSSSSFFFEFAVFDQWKLNVDEDDIMNAKKKYENQMQIDDVSASTRFTLPVMAMGTTNHNFPFLQYLYDTYARYLINFFITFGYETQLFNTSVKQWALKYPFFEALSRKEEPVFQKIVKAVDEYKNSSILAVSAIPLSISVGHKRVIRDDVAAFVKYISAAIQFINNLNDTKYTTTPYQFDMTIIPWKQFELDSKHLTSDGKVEPIPERQSWGYGWGFWEKITRVMTIKEDKIGDIESTKLYLEKMDVNIDHTTHDELVKNIEDLYSKFKTNFINKHKSKLSEFYNGYASSKFYDKHQKICNFSDLESNYPLFRRVCAVVDRRKDMYKNNRIYMFEAEIGDELPNDDDIVPEAYHWNSLKYVIPNDTVAFDPEIGRVRGPGFGSKDSLGITASFHVENANQIKCYLWWNNAFYRFFPDDLINIVPLWFDKEHGHNEAFPNEEFKQIIDNLEIPDLHYKDLLQALFVK